MHLRLFSANVITKICLLTLYVGFAISPTPEPPNIKDSAKSGNYLIVYCNSTFSGPHAAYLQALIPFMQENLQAVLSDLEHGTTSAAYRAFFKTNDSLDDVRQVFTNIINGSDVLGVAFQNDTRWSSPTLVCADSNQHILRQLARHCSAPSRPLMSVLQPAKIISICPDFWTLPRIVQKAACPRVSRDGELLTEPFNLYTTQFAVLVHELVHVYNPADNREEIYDLGPVVDLSAARSLENAQNYASYAAGEFLFVA